MLINPLIAALVPVILSIFIIEITKKIRNENRLINFAIILLAFILSMMLGANTSIDPEASGEYLTHLWLVYLIFVFIRKRLESDKKSPSENGKPNA